MTQDQSNERSYKRPSAARNALAALLLVTLCALEAYLGWSALGKEFLFDVTCGLFGAILFYWSKPMARGLSDFADRCYERFPKLKVLPGSQNAGTELNYKATYVCFRVCGAFLLISSVLLFSIFFLSLHRK
jgi:hypothetical protein